MESGAEPQSFKATVAYLELKKDKGCSKFIFFPMQPEPDFARFGFGMTNPTGAGFSN